MDGFLEQCCLFYRKAFGSAGAVARMEKNATSEEIEEVQDVVAVEETEEIEPQET